MDILTGSNDLGTLGLGLAIAGAVAGLMAGVLGRGAGLILVTALFLVARAAGLTPEPAIRMAIGTAFLCQVPLVLSRAATIKPSEIPRALMLPMLGGVLLSVLTTAAFVPVQVFVVAATAVIAAGLTAAVSEPHPGGNPLIQRAAALIGTALAGLTGLSGLSLTAPLLMRSGISRAAAEASATVAAIAITLTGAAMAVISGWDVHGLPQHSYGYVNLLAFGIAAPLAFACQMIGAHYAELIEAKRLRWLFAAFVIFSAARMVWSVVG